VKLVVKRQKTKNKSSVATKNHTGSRKHHTSFSEHEEDGSCLNMKERALKAITSQINFKNGSIYPSTDDKEGDSTEEEHDDDTKREDSDEGLEEKNGTTGCLITPSIRNGTKGRSQSFGHSLHPKRITSSSNRHRSTSSAISDFETEESRTVQQNVPPTSNGPAESNTLLDILHKRSNSVFETTTTTTTILSQTKVHFSPETAVNQLDEPSVQHLESTYKLLVEYLDDNYLSKQRSHLCIFGLMITLFAATFVLGTTVFELSSPTIFHLLFIIVLIGVTIILVGELTNRFERTAIKGILEEVAALISLAPNAPLAN